MCCMLQVEVVVGPAEEVSAQRSTEATAGGGSGSASRRRGHGGASSSTNSGCQREQRKSLGIWDTSGSPRFHTLSRR